MQRIIGPDIYARVNILQHDGINSDFTFVGTTSRGNDVYINRAVTDADRVILTGGIILHHLAGYGGGRKNIIPGVARQDSIFFNHRMMVDPRAEAGNIDDNPIHEDVVEACSMVNPDFLFNVITDHQGAIAAAVAGHWQEVRPMQPAVTLLICYTRYQSNNWPMLSCASGGVSPRTSI